MTRVVDAGNLYARGAPRRCPFLEHLQLAGAGDACHEDPRILCARPFALGARDNPPLSSGGCSPSAVSCWHAEHDDALIWRIHNVCQLPEMQRPWFMDGGNSHPRRLDRSTVAKLQVDAVAVRAAADPTAPVRFQVAKEVRKRFAYRFLSLDLFEPILKQPNRSHARERRGS
jgi:hypothetical protein